MPAAFGIGVKGSGPTPRATSAGASQASGSTFYVWAVWDSSGTFTSVVDSKSNSYTIVGSELTVGTMKARLYKCVNGTGGASHTATFTVSAGDITLFLVEATGCDTVSPVDQSDRRTDSASPYTLAAGLTTTQANELLLTFLCGDSGANPATHAETGLGSSTIAVEETNGSANWTGAVAWSYKTSTGTFNPSWTESSNTNACVALETLKEATGGAAGSGPNPRTIWVMP